jgi:hypothetical protein
MTADKLIPLMNNALRAAANRSYHPEMFHDDYRRAVSVLFKAVVGRFPSQAELEAIDPDFKVKED